MCSKQYTLIVFGVCLLFSIFAGFSPLIVRAESLSQIPTVAIATVTGTPNAAMVTASMEFDQINVRGGPSTDYPIVGVIIAGQRVPALGRSLGGDWIQIAYPGIEGGVAWVYAPNVTIEGNLQVVAPPPSPTPKTTPTIDPTLAAQFIVEIPPTRLPTYTAPAPLAIPTFGETQSSSVTEQLPMGLIIVGLGVLGLFGTVISLLGRR